MQCPWCGQEADRRKKGCCPNCGKEVHIYKIGRGKKKTTVWVANKPSITNIVKRLEKHILSELPEFSFGGYQDKSYLEQLAYAKVLLQKCNLDQRVAERVVDLHFKGIPGLYKKYSLVALLGNTFPRALAIARKEIDAEDEEAKLQQERLNQIEALDVQYAL